MAIECSNTESVDWSAIVGNKTLEDGGHFGDLMELGRLHIEDSKYKGELTEQDAGQVYGALMTTAITQSINFELVRALRDMEVCNVENTIENDKCLAEADCALKAAQTAEIVLESARKDCTAQSTCDVNEAQINKLECDCTNDIATTASNISLNAAQENKLACECCNNSKQTESQLLLNDAQIDKMICDCCNDTTSTNSKAALDRAQESKIQCDCTNETNLAVAKTALTQKEIAGIEYSARQKLYDAQLVAWAVVYADMQLPDTPMSVKEDAIDKSYQEIVTFLGTT